MASGTTTQEIDGKATGQASTSPVPANPLAERIAPAFLADAAEDVTQGGVSVKKMAVRVAAFGGGIVSVLLAGGAMFKVR